MKKKFLAAVIAAAASAMLWTASVPAAEPAAEPVVTEEAAPAAEPAAPAEETPAAEAAAPAENYECQVAAVEFAFDFDAAPAAEPAAEPVVTEEAAPAEETTEIMVLGDVVEEPAAEPAATEEPAPAPAEDAVLPATEEETDPATTEETTPETEDTLGGELIGEPNHGYVVMDDGNDAWCVEETKQHVDSDAQYVEATPVVDTAVLDPVFVAITNADEAGLDKTQTRQIAQLAIWELLNHDDSNRRMVELFFGSSALGLFDTMVSGQYEGNWEITYKGYAPVNEHKWGAYQNLVSGKAVKVLDEVPEEPEEPEEPEVPEEPETPEEPEVPETPEVPSKPEIKVVEKEVIKEVPVVKVVEKVATVQVTPDAPVGNWNNVPQTGCVNVSMIALLVMILCAASLTVCVVAKKN